MLQWVLGLWVKTGRIGLKRYVPFKTLPWKYKLITIWFFNGANANILWAYGMKIIQFYNNWP